MRSFQTKLIEIKVGVVDSDFDDTVFRIGTWTMNNLDQSLFGHFKHSCLLRFSSSIDRLKQQELGRGKTCWSIDSGYESTEIVTYYLLCVYRQRQRKREYVLKCKQKSVFGHFLVPLKSPVYLLSESHCLFWIALE